MSIARTGAAAVQLRVNGASFHDIANTLGLPDARAAIRHVTNELALQAQDDDDGDGKRDTLRAEEDARLMALIGPMMMRAQDPGDPEQIAATRVALSIVDRRIKLHGLDAPTEITVHTPTQTELDNWVTEMVKLAMPPAAISEPDVLDVESWGDDD